MILSYRKKGESVETSGELSPAVKSRSPIHFRRREERKPKSFGGFWSNLFRSTNPDHQKPTKFDNQTRKVRTSCSSSSSESVNTLLSTHSFSFVTGNAYVGRSHHQKQRKGKRIPLDELDTKDKNIRRKPQKPHGEGQNSTFSRIGMKFGLNNLKSKYNLQSCESLAIPSGGVDIHKQNFTHFTLQKQKKEISNLKSENFESSRQKSIGESEIEISSKILCNSANELKESRRKLEDNGEFAHARNNTQSDEFDSGWQNRVSQNFESRHQNENSVSNHEIGNEKPGILKVNQQYTKDSKVFKFPYQTSDFEFTRLFQKTDSDRNTECKSPKSLYTSIESTNQKLTHESILQSLHKNSNNSLNQLERRRKNFAIKSISVPTISKESLRDHDFEFSHQNTLLKNTNLLPKKRRAPQPPVSQNFETRHNTLQLSFGKERENTKFQTTNNDPYDQNRHRRCQSESGACAQTKTRAHVPGKRRAPSPPNSNRILKNFEVELNPSTQASLPTLPETEEIMRRGKFQINLSLPLVIPLETQSHNSHQHEEQMSSTPMKISPRPWYKRSTSKSPSKRSNIKPITNLPNISNLDREAARIVEENHRRSAEQAYNQTAKELISMFNSTFTSTIGQENTTKNCPTTNSAQNGVSTKFQNTEIEEKKKLAIVQPQKSELSKIKSNFSTPITGVEQVQLIENNYPRRENLNNYSQFLYEGNETENWACPRCTLVNPHWRALCDLCFQRKDSPIISLTSQMVNNPANQVECHQLKKPQIESNTAAYKSTTSEIIPIQLNELPIVDETKLESFPPCENFLSQLPSKDNFSKEIPLISQKLEQSDVEGELDIEQLRQARVAFFTKCNVDFPNNFKPNNFNPITDLNIKELNLPPSTIVEEEELSDDYEVIHLLLKIHENENLDYKGTKFPKVYPTTTKFQPILEAISESRDSNSKEANFSNVYKNLLAVAKTEREELPTNTFMLKSIKSTIQEQLFHYENIMERDGWVNDLTLEEYRKQGAVPKQLVQRRSSENHDRRHFMQDKKKAHAHEVSNLLRKLDRAISLGDHRLAAKLAYELALEKVEPVGAKAEEPITIRVYVEDRLMQQGPFLVNVSQSMSVGALKAKVESDWGIPKNFQKWILGKKMTEEDTDEILKYGLVNESLAFLYLVTPEFESQGSSEIKKAPNSNSKINPYQNVPNTITEVSPSAHFTPKTSKIDKLEMKEQNSTNLVCRNEVNKCKISNTDTILVKEKEQKLNMNTNENNNSENNGDKQILKETTKILQHEKPSLQTMNTTNTNVVGSSYSNNEMEGTFETPALEPILSISNDDTKVFQNLQQKFLPKIASKIIPKEEIEKPFVKNITINIIDNNKNGNKCEEKMKTEPMIPTSIKMDSNLVDPPISNYDLGNIVENTTIEKLNITESMPTNSVDETAEVDLHPSPTQCVPEEQILEKISFNHSKVPNEVIQNYEKQLLSDDLKVKSETIENFENLDTFSSTHSVITPTITCEKNLKNVIENDASDVIKFEAAGTSHSYTEQVSTMPSKNLKNFIQPMGRRNSLEPSSNSRMIGAVGRRFSDNLSKQIQKFEAFTSQRKTTDNEISPKNTLFVKKNLQKLPTGREFENIWTEGKAISSGGNSVMYNIRSKSLMDQSEERAENYQKLLELEKADLIRCMEEVDCLICLSKIPSGDGVVLRDCLHIFCNECLAGAIEYAEEAQVKCPYRDDKYSCDSFLQEREIKALVSSDIFNRLLERSVKLAECKISNTFHCKTNDCHGWCVFEDNVNIFQCPVCSMSNCLNCQAIHEGLDCQQYQRELAAASETDADARSSRLMLEKMIEKGEALDCPACHVVLLKKWGCDWVRCSYCKTEICWVTKGFRWGVNGKGDISGGCRCGVNGIKCHQKCTYCH